MNGHAQPSETMTRFGPSEQRDSATKDIIAKERTRTAERTKRLRAIRLARDAESKTPPIPPANSNASPMILYHIYQVDNDGDFVHGSTFLLPYDEAAFAKAREYCRDCNVEVWKGQQKIALFRPSGSDGSEQGW